MDWNSIIDILIGALGGGGVIGVVLKTSLKKYLHDLNNSVEVGRLLPDIQTALKETTALKAGLLGINQFYLVKECNIWIDKGYCYANEKIVLQRLYENYRSLGGNGMVTALFNKVLILPEHKEEK